MHEAGEPLHVLAAQGVAPFALERSDHIAIIGHANSLFLALL
jgi:hypothetical protein